MALSDRHECRGRPFPRRAGHGGHRRTARPHRRRPGPRADRRPARRAAPDLGHRGDAAQAAAHGHGAQVPGGHEDRGHRGRDGQDQRSREAADSSRRDEGPAVGQPPRPGSRAGYPGLAGSRGLAMGWNGHGAWEDDQELDWIFPDEPELRQTAHLLRRVPRPEAPLDPAFRAALRRRLMQEAWDRAAPALPWWRRLLAPQSMAWAGATVGVVLIAFVVYALTFTPAKPDSQQVIVSSPLQGSHAVAATEPIQLQFSQPMDTASVEQALQIQPATKVKSYQWVNGNSTVQIVPQNGLAPNTQYQVTLSPKAKTQAGAAVAKKPRVTFVTAPPPTPQATPTPAPTPRPTPPPGITSPRQIAPSGTPSPAWTPDGQTLFVIDTSGQLRGFSVASGAAQPVVAADGATVVAVGPDGTLAYA